ncbi:tRNA-modifying protein YgfZ [Colwellia sp. MEBiC06753]
MTTALPDISELPDEFTLRLTSFSAISLIGEEQQKYLQGQVTCDVNAQTEHNLQHGAHCDAKGKVLSVFRLIQRQNALLLLQPAATIGQSLAELKKFGVFAKVEINQASDLTFACIVGKQSAQQLKNVIGALPDELTPVVHNDTLSIAYLAGDICRYLVIGDVTSVDNCLAKITAPNLNPLIWQLLEITEGFPTLSESAVQQYVPQMLNLDKIHGISFTKGCYLGQETVARMQYLGKNKKMMALLIGQSDVELPEDLALEKQLGENWRSAGDVLSYYQASNGKAYLQAVIANDLTSEDNIRVKGLENASLRISPLPYINQQTN